MLFYYDLEVFPNYFSAFFISEDGMDTYLFEKYEGVDHLKELSTFVTRLPDLTLVGYNSIAYDDVMLAAIIEKPEMTNRQLFSVSSLIIRTDNKKDLPGALSQIAFAERCWYTIDLLKLLQVNMNMPSLKHCSIHLEHPRLQDLPLPFDKNIKLKDIPVVREYNENDVIITRKILEVPAVKEAIELRLKMGEVYGVDLRSAGDSKISNVIFQARYGTPEVRATRRDIIYGRDLIPPTLDFRTAELQLVLNKLNTMVLVETEPYKHMAYYDVDGTRISAEVGADEYDTEEVQGAKFNHSFMFNGVKFVMGQGGLHTDDPPRRISPANDTILRDADVGSYYPSMILQYELVPEHLDKVKFLQVYRAIVVERLEGKHSGDKVKADGLKIAINGAFGKLNFPYFWLYDPLAFYRVTLYGQLFLLDLIEKFYLAGIQCISANTDGVVCHFPKEKEDEYFAVCDEWQKRTGMNLEYTDYDLMVQLNVNSYLSHAVHEITYNDDGLRVVKDIDKLKMKKDFESGKKLQKQTFVRGYQAPVIALALKEYFVNNVPPEVFIREHNNIHDFFYTQRAGAKFSLYYRTLNGADKLQKTNRYYVSTSGGTLVKRDETEIQNVGIIAGSFKSTRETSILQGKYVRIMNDVPKEFPSTIDYNYYIAQVRTIIGKIEPKKVRRTIFDLQG